MGESGRCCLLGPADNLSVRGVNGMRSGHPMGFFLLSPIQRPGGDILYTEFIIQGMIEDDASIKCTILLFRIGSM